MGVRVAVEHGNVLVHLSGVQMLRAATRTVGMRLTDVASARVVSRRDLGMFGTRGRAPWSLFCGFTVSLGCLEFWCVRRAEWLLLVEGRSGARYDRMVLEVADPHADALLIEKALRG